VRIRTLALTLLLAGCNVGPDFLRPKPSLPDSYSQQAMAPPRYARNGAVAEQVDEAWWQQFDDPSLVLLMHDVEVGNPDIREVASRIAETRAQRDIAYAGFFPTLDFAGSDTRLRISQNSPFAALAGSTPGVSAGAQPNASQGAAIPTGPKPGFAIYQLGFDAAWELDLWGRTRRSVEASEADTAVAEEALHDSLLSLRAEAARTYMELRGLQARRDVTRHAIDLQRQTVALTRSQRAAGFANELDLANAEAQLAGTESQLPLLDGQVTAAINRLSRLMGREPGALVERLGEATPVPAVPQMVSVGLPVELARRRPDVRRAEEELAAQTARIGVAVAQLYPTVRINGSIGLQSGNTANLFAWASRFYSVGPTLVLPIFEGGRLRAQVRLEEARQRTAALTWGRTLLDAAHEVENGLATYYAEQGRYAGLERQARAARSAAALSRQRFAAGIGSFLEVLEAERTRLAVELSLAESRALLATDLIAIYKALGGGWQPEQVATRAKGAAGG
jgi:outer membrane protein, multidrug efflux system